MGTAMKIREQRGGSALEFAIVLSLLVLILFGIIEFGLVLYNQQVITNASREGARAGIVARSPRLSVGEISAVVNAYCAGNLVTFGSAVSPAVNIDNSGGASFGDDLEVEVAWQYDFLVLPDFLGRPLVAKTVMKYE
jgi:Flp pilus assembly protein TadG